MSLLLISDARWREIRSEFTEDEKVTLRSVIVNRLVCPAGVEIDAEKLDASLHEKIVGLTLRRRRTA